MDLLTKHGTHNNPVLKIVAAVLFIALPIIGFSLGLQYKVLVDTTEQTSINQINNTNSTQPISQSPIKNPISSTPEEELIFAYNSLTKKAETQSFKAFGGHKLFTKEEVDDIKRNLAQPLFDYMNEKGDNLALVIRITKPSLFFQVIFNNGGTRNEGHYALIYKDRLYWNPGSDGGCMGRCEISEVYKQKQPRIVTLYDCLNPIPPQPRRESSECLDLFFQN